MIITANGFGGLIFPGNSLPPFPSSTLAAYLSIAECVTLNGSTVAEWQDISGNDYHMTQATSSKQPTWYESGDNHEIRTDGVDDIMFTPAMTVSQPFRVFICGKVLAYTANAYILCGRGENFGVVYQNPSSGYARPYSGANGQFIIPTVAPADNKLLEFYFNGASSESFLNGVSAGVLNAGSSGNTGFAIGGYFSELAGYFSNFSYSALVVLGPAATNDDVTYVRDLLTGAFGVA